MKKGFTLFEILLVLAITAILFSFALPLGRSFFSEDQSHLLCDQIKSSFRYARNAAILRHQTLLLLPLTKHNWSSGSVLVEAQSGAILHQWQWDTPGWTVQWTGMLGHDFLRFSPTIRQAALSGHFFVKNEKQSIKLIVNRVGRIHEST